MFYSGSRFSKSDRNMNRHELIQALSYYTEAQVKDNNNFIQNDPQKELNDSQNRCYYRNLTIPSFLSLRYKFYSDHSCFIN
jgi:hypothetical protein